MRQILFYISVCSFVILIMYVYGLDRYEAGRDIESRRETPIHKFLHSTENETLIIHTKSGFVAYVRKDGKVTQFVNGVATDKDTKGANWLNHALTDEEIRELLK